MIDYTRIGNDEYIKNIKNDINSLSNVQELSDIRKSISVKLQYKEIDQNTAIELLTEIKNRANYITGLKRQGKSTLNGGKVMRLSPTSTAVSNRRGSASIIFLIVNIALTTIMYTLLIAGKLIG